MASYAVKSQHFKGDHSNPKAAKIKPEEHKSWKRIKNSPTSYGYGDNFRYTVENGLIHLRTSNRDEVYPLHDVAKYRQPVVQYWEESAKSMDGWNANGNDNPPVMNNYIQKMPNLAYITGVKELGLYLPNNRDTTVKLKVTPRILEAVDPNKIGYYESLKSSQYDTLRSMIDPARYKFETAEWIDFLAKEGFSIPKNPWITGLGVQEDSFLAAYYMDKGFLVTSGDFHKKAKELLSRYGSDDVESIEAAKRHALLHELAHVVGIGRYSGKRIPEELQGYLQAKFYKMMADKYKGTKPEEDYKRLALDGMDYAEGYSLWHTIWREITKDPFQRNGNDLEQILKEKFITDAYEIGIDESEVIDYVTSRMDGTLGAFDSGKPSFKASNKKARYKKSESARDENLEEKVENSGRESTSSLTLIKGSRYSEKKGKKTYERNAKEKYSREADNKPEDTAKEPMQNDKAPDGGQSVKEAA